MEKRKALGRGLGALIPDSGRVAPEITGVSKQESIIYLDIDNIMPNRYQPRENFNQEKLNELINSIKEKGVVQPLLVRQVGDKFELIAGERRMRALKSLSIKKAPVIFKEVDDLGAIELALIENIQREGLNPIEEARAYKRLVEEFNFTQDKVSQTVSKDRSSVANAIRLLNLPIQIQKHLIQGAINTGHARALLVVKGLQQQLNLCKKIMNKGLSAREAELLANPQLKRRKRAALLADQNLMAQEEALQNALATKVRIQHGKKRGKIVIEYFSLEDLDRIINKIKS